MSKATLKIEELLNMGIEELNSMVNTSVSGFVVNGKSIEYKGNPSALKYNVPIMSQFAKMVGFKEVRTPKTYEKDGQMKSTDIVTWTFTCSVDNAQAFCDKVNEVCDKRYEEYLAKKESKNK